MNKLVLFLFFQFVGLGVSAHAYYFAFAELQLNKDNNKLELTVIINSHDIEHWIKKSDFSYIEFENKTQNKNLNNYLSSNILNGFIASIDSSMITFNFIDYSIKKDGNIEFYFESESISPPSQIEVRFDLLMDDYPEQQNKLIYLNQDIKKSYGFLRNTKTHLIKL